MRPRTSTEPKIRLPSPRRGSDAQRASANALLARYPTSVFREGVKLDTSQVIDRRGVKAGLPNNRMNAGTSQNDRERRARGLVPRLRTAKEMDRPRLKSKAEVEQGNRIRMALSRRRRISKGKQGAVREWSLERNARENPDY